MLTVLGKARKQRFLKAFAMCGVIGEAAKLAKVARCQHSTARNVNTEEKLR